MGPEDKRATRAMEISERCLRIAKETRELRLMLCPPQGTDISELWDPALDPLVEMCRKKGEEYQDRKI